jgi:hypothetical protein
MLSWISSIFLAILFFTLYAEFSPGMGGIFMRPGIDGKFVFTIVGLVHFITAPLRHWMFWTPEFWDLNIFIAVPVLSGMIRCVSYVSALLL